MSLKFQLIIPVKKLHFDKKYRLIKLFNISFQFIYLIKILYN